MSHPVPVSQVLGASVGEPGIATGIATSAEVQKPARASRIAYDELVNFFGHVVVTSWQSSEPAVALGAMLPDLANMCRGRVVRALDPEVAVGMDLHHATDRVFHALPAFSDLERDTSQRLQARGVNRGGAMGTAHVAVELLLDGLLLDDRDAAELYLAALCCDPAMAKDARSEWHKPEQSQRWPAMRQRLNDHGLPEGYRDPDVVTDRIAMILSRYKTLALADWEVSRVRAELQLLRPRVATSLPTIMDGLRREFSPKPQK